MNQIKQHIQQLNSPNPAARREAIIALGKLANPAAIGPLTQASENDPDPVLQEFARKAVRHIQKGQPQQVETIDATPETLSLPALSGEIDEIEEPSDALI